MHLGDDILSYLEYKYETLLGADHLIFDGGGGDAILKKILQGNSEKNTCTNDLAEKISYQVFCGKNCAPNKS